MYEFGGQKSVHITGARHAVRNGNANRAESSEVDDNPAFSVSRVARRLNDDVIANNEAVHAAFLVAL